MLTGNLSGEISGGMGIAGTQLALQLASISHLHLITSEADELPNIQNVSSLRSTEAIPSVSSFLPFSPSFRETIQYDFLISPYRTDQYENTSSLFTEPSPTGEEIKNSPLSYLEEVALYNQKIIEVAQTLVFDVIYCHDWPTFQAGISLKLLTGKKLVLHIHSLEADRNPANKDPKIYYLERKAMDYADGVIAVSEYTRNMIRKYYEIYPGKIKVVYNAFLPLTINRLPANSKTVLFMGRLTPQKGAAHFISIAEAIHRKDPEVLFVMAGEGELRKELEEQLRNSPVANLFQMPGFLNTEDKLRYLSSASVFCLPSESEPFGLSALEAAGSGIPCVVSNQSGISEILSGALTVDSHDIAGFAFSILSLLENDSLRTSVTEKQLSSIQDLTWERSAHKILEILSGL